MNPRTAFAFAGALAISFIASATDIDTSKLPPPSDKQGLTFDKDVKPLFEKSCVECHGEVKPKGKLRLDTLAGTIKGGIDGKVLEAGKSADSFLVANIAYLGNEDDFMPPPKDVKKYPKLTAEQVGLIRAWIDQGAK
ncbi:MAG TPA: c-type cytochrome domain-containing protein [Candidatus Polarisedimenticolia bacterium]|nr:c-type cytochrome domain-containing protein [Candidatus Polarisedimenticolia bacterium]